eukprot:gene6577-6432_t
MQSAVRSLETVYLDRVVPLRDLKKIADLYAVNIVDATHKARNGNFTKTDSLSRIDQAQKEIDLTWQAYKSTQLIAAETRLIAQIDPLMAATRGPLQSLLGILRQNDDVGLARFSIEQLYPLFDPLSDKFAELIEVQLLEARNQFEQNHIAYTANLRLCLLILLLATLAGAAYSWFFSRQLGLQLGAEPAELAAISSNIAHGKLARTQDDRQEPSTGVLHSVQAMRHSLSDMIGKIGQASEQIEVATLQLSASSEQGLSSAALQSETASSMAATVEELSDSMAAGCERVTQGQKLVASAGQSMGRIKGALDESIAAVSFISLSLQEQRAASDQVASNVEKVAQSVEENATAQGAIVRTTQELKAMSEGLGTMLQRFSL